MSVISISSEDEQVEIVDHDTLGYIGNQPITEQLLSRLTSPTWLNDEIINAHLHLVCSLHEGIDYLNTFWMIRKYAPPANWQSLRLLFIPLNLGNSHWALAVMEPTERRLTYYDSLMNRNRGMAKLKEIQAYFQAIPAERSPDSSLLEYLMQRLSLRSSDQFTLAIASCEQQSDGHSCGVFVCQWATRLAFSLSSEPQRWIEPGRFRRVMREQFKEALE